jgi:hypothetical protein
VCDSSSSPEDNSYKSNRPSFERERGREGEKGEGRERETKEKSVCFREEQRKAG